MTSPAAHAETIRRVKNELDLHDSMPDEHTADDTFASDVRALVAQAERAVALEAERDALLRDIEYALTTFESCAGAYAYLTRAALDRDAG